jgi:hypothetical protein
VAVPLIAWAVVILTVRQAQSAVLAPQAQTGAEAASALAWLCAALALVRSERVGHRLHWVAGGLVVLGLGGLVFGYVQRLLHSAPVHFVAFLAPLGTAPVVVLWLS